MQRYGNFSNYTNKVGAIRYLLESEDKIDRQDEAEGGEEVVPAELEMEGQHGETDEDHQGDDLLNDLELHKGEGSAIGIKTYTVGRYLQAILKQGYSPRHEDNQDEGCMVGDEMHILHLKMTVPSQRHKDIGRQKKKYGI